MTALAITCVFLGGPASTLRAHLWDGAAEACKVDSVDGKFFLCQLTSALGPITSQAVDAQNGITGSYQDDFSNIGQYRYYFHQHRRA